MKRLSGGHGELLGATVQDQGVNFALFAPDAEAVELCLFEDDGPESARCALPVCSQGVWHGFLPGCQAGQAYGYRINGPWNPGQGLRFNPNKLLIDPWAKALQGPFQWSPAVYDHQPGPQAGSWLANDLDSAAFVPRSLVTNLPRLQWGQRAGIPWSEAIIYEANVRGFTMRHPSLDETQRGRFRGLANGEILGRLKALGITSIELQPVQAFIDEAFLVERGLRNLWGYNSINFFAPEPRLAGSDPVGEFREMVDAIHDAGLEVILDVVYNHTGEGGTRGPTLSFRGIANQAYYRTEPADPVTYINDTGTGNTINADHPRVQQMVLGSLEYWHRTMGVDGFRFDLATVLGRKADGFTPLHPLLSAIGSAPALKSARMIAEPWDPGPGGYQLGRFPARWSEWNDRYRDSTREFWRGDAGTLADFAQRLHGSADLFDRNGRGPCNSINFVTSHDGFTLSDLVSYERRHNQDNGEDNLDGHGHNYSCNHGVEGNTTDAGILAERRRHRLNLLASLMFSQGVPMLLAGDEMGNSQGGNNNAYAQDNETGWLDWSGLILDEEFTEQVRKLIELRKRYRLLRRPDYLHGDTTGPGPPDNQWLRPDGQLMESLDWPDSKAVLNLLRETVGACHVTGLALLFNGHEHEVTFQLPECENGAGWTCVFTTGQAAQAPGNTCQLEAMSMALLEQRN